MLDLVRYPDYDNVHRSLRNFRESAFEGIETRFSRLRVSPSDEVAIEDVYEGACEFPQHDWRLTTSVHRFAYMAAGAEGQQPFGTIMKVDHVTGSVSSHEFGRGQVAGERLLKRR